MKKLNLTVTFLSLFLLCGCGIKPIADNFVTSFIEQEKVNRTITVSDIEIQNILKYFKRTDTNIATFQFVKEVNGAEVITTSESFLRGLYDQIGLKLKCIYDDGKTRYLDLLSKRLPNSYNQALFEVGVHTFIIAYKGQEIAISLETIYNEDIPDVYVKYYNYQGELLYTYLVEMGTALSVEIPEVPDREEDNQFIYAEKEWDQNLEGVALYSNYDVHPRYTPVLKRSHGRLPIPTFDNGSVHRVLCNYNLGFLGHYQFFHIARIRRVPILGYNVTQPASNIVNHVEGTENTISFNFKEYIDTVGKEQIQADIINSAMHFDDTKPSSFAGGNEKAIPSGFTHKPTNDQSIVDYAKSLGGMSKTVFEEGGIIYDLFETYLGDVLDDYVTAHPGEVTATIPKESQNGTYRLCVEADLDVEFLAIISHDSDNDKLITLESLVTFLSIDEETVETIVDYDKTAEFKSTGLITYSAEDIYKDVMSNLDVEISPYE